jgi:O-antigen ligase
VVATALVGGAALVARPRLEFASPVVRAWTALLAVWAVVTITGVDPLLGLVGDPARLMGLLGLALVFVGFVAGQASGAALGSITRAAVVGCGVAVAVALVQIVPNVGDRATGSFGNAGFLAAYLCLVVPVAIVECVRSAGAWRWTAGAIAGAGVFVLAATQTRGGWIGFSVAAAVLVAAVVRRWWPVAAVAVVVTVVAFAPLAARDTGRGRLDTWEQSVAVIKARPLLGWGPEGFRTGFARHVDADWVRTYSLDQIPDRAHNRFLDVAASTGVFGLVADVTLLVVTGIALRRRLALSANRSPEWWLTLGVAAGVAGYLTQQMFLFETFDLSLIAWTLLGVALAPRQPSTATEPVTHDRNILVAAVALLSVFALANLVADRLVQSASGADLDVAVDRLDLAATVRPRALDTYLLLGSVALASDDADLVDRAHDRLVGWSVDPYVSLRDADVFAHYAALTDDPDLVSVVFFYRQARLSAPTNGAAWLGLGTALLKQNDLVEARQALRRAAFLLPGRAEPEVNLAIVERANGNDVVACRHLGRALEKPHHPSRTMLRAIAPPSCAL